MRRKPPCEFKVLRLRESADPNDLVDTPERAA